MKLEDLKFTPDPTMVDTEKWDKDLWREEHPMDYLLALNILLQANHPEVQDELFKTIYRVTRLHIPDVLYKYYSLTDNISKNNQKLETLQNGKIYLSDFKSFNDPFDGKGYFYNSDELKDIERLRPHAGKMIDDFTVFERAASLTSAGAQSMPMWAHYANNHSGFCVAYDMTENKTLSSLTFPIQYIDERIDVTSIMKKQAIHISEEIDRQTAIGGKQITLKDLSIIYMVSMLCNLKLSSWSYEQEYRCTVGKTMSKKQYIDAYPKEIYVGQKCTDKNRKILIDLARDLNIPIYQMKFNECSESFELIAEEISD